MAWTSWCWSYICFCGLGVGIWNSIPKGTSAIGPPRQSLETPFQKSNYCSTLLTYQKHASIFNKVFVASPGCLGGNIVHISPQQNTVFFSIIGESTKSPGLALGYSNMSNGQRYCGLQIHWVFRDRVLLGSSTWV